MCGWHPVLYTSEDEDEEENMKKKSQATSTSTEACIKFPNSETITMGWMFYNSYSKDK